MGLPSRALAPVSSPASADRGRACSLCRNAERPAVSPGNSFPKHLISISLPCQRLSSSPAACSGVQRSTAYAQIEHTGVDTEMGCCLCASRKLGPTYFDPFQVEGRGLGNVVPFLIGAASPISSISCCWSSAHDLASFLIRKMLNCSRPYFRIALANGAFFCPRASAQCCRQRSSIAPVVWPTYSLLLNRHLTM